MASNALTGEGSSQTASGGERVESDIQQQLIVHLSSMRYNNLTSRISCLQEPRTPVEMRVRWAYQLMKMMRKSKQESTYLNQTYTTVLYM